MRTKLQCNKIFHKNFISYRNEKTQILINKPVSLDISILDMSKNLIHEFWCDYLNPKYGENLMLCYMDTDRFIVQLKLYNIMQRCLTSIMSQKQT